MPVALDFGIWLRTCGVLSALECDIQPALLLDDCPDDSEALESLIEWIEIDGSTYLELSAAGQIFHETFRHRFQSDRDRVLPPAVPAAQKRPPKIGEHGVLSRHRDA